MESPTRSLRSSWFSLWPLVIWIFVLCSQASAANTRWIPFTNDEGTIYLDDDRRPALYTGDFGDCQGNSLINVTRFDASLYRDNMTVMFHMAGTTDLPKQHVTMYFSVFAYGENRFDLTFNPCTINIPTLCPLNASIPIEANGLIPIGTTDLAGIPSVAFSIPDFEGQAILRLFSNTTQSQIACYSAVMKNGNSFSHPAAVGSVLGVFTVVALVSSVAVTIYGQLVPETRVHYAHSMSVFVVFSVLQHIFFTGSLSMNWPSVLVAFWSNYAWSAGMIYSRKMQSSINQFVGSNRGNISSVGSAPNNQDFPYLGGISLNQIYKRDAAPIPVSALAKRSMEHMLHRRDLVNSSTGFDWYGFPVAPGLPLPGNYSGFAGTLAQINIPASNAFLTGLLWLLILIVMVAALMVALKWTVEACVKIKLLRTGRLDFFRSHWIRFTGAAAMRTCFIGFFMMIYLTLFQFVLGGSKGVVAVAGIVFVSFLFGLFAIAGYALWYRLGQSKFRLDADKLQIVPRKHGLVTWYGATCESSEKLDDPSAQVVKKLPWFRAHVVDSEDRAHVHDDQNFTIRFGWLSSRFRRSKWWFFSAWLVYEFVRACFYGGAAGHPLTQVFGLLAWEIIAFIAVVIMKPFESSRLNLIMVYFLGFSKVATVALSSAFDPRFQLNRIMTTVVGVIIIVIQGALTICLLIAIAVGAISTYLSMSRDHDTIKPVSWTDMRTRYLAHIAQKATDQPRVSPTSLSTETETTKEPYFTVSAVRREPKIEDDDTENTTVEEVHEVEEPLDPDSDANKVYRTRARSVRSSHSNLPYGARSHHRRSWSVKDLTNPSVEQSPSGLNSRMSMENISELSMKYRASSLIDLPANDGPATAYAAEPPNRSHRRIRSASNPLRIQKNRRSLKSMDAVPYVQAEETETS